MTNRANLRYADPIVPRALSSKYNAVYMRKWRKTHPPTVAQKVKANARAYAKEYRRRGWLCPMPCMACGSHDSEMHHPDYRQPLLVEWLCRTCHLALHKAA
jgi:hypothetical protein